MTLLVAKGTVHMPVIRLLRSGITVVQVNRYVTAKVHKHYLKLKSELYMEGTRTWYNFFDALRTLFFEYRLMVDAMRGGKVNVVGRNSFSQFPAHFVPCRPHLTAMFVNDYWEKNKPLIWTEGNVVLDLTWTIPISTIKINNQHQPILFTSFLLF